MCKKYERDIKYSTLPLHGSTSLQLVARLTNTSNHRFTEVKFSDERCLYLLSQYWNFILIRQMFVGLCLHIILIMTTLPFPSR